MPHVMLSFMSQILETVTVLTAIVINIHHSIASTDLLVHYELMGVNVLQEPVKRFAL